MVVNLEDIVKKYPFVYKVNNRYYCIGCFKFAECNNTLIHNYYDKYEEIIAGISQVRWQTNKLSKDESDLVLYYFKRMRGYADSILVSDSPDKVRKQTLEFIFNLADEEKLNLLSQLKDFVYAYQYSNSTNSHWRNIE